MNRAQPDRILKDLAELWASLGKDQNANASQGVLRACAMTLIVTNGGNREPPASQSIAELMREHPSRAIVLHLDGTMEGAIEARVFAQCWMPFGSRQQICCEQIEIMAPRGRAEGLSSMILPLIAPDLPVVLWARGSTLFDQPELERLISLAGTVAGDSGAAPDPAVALQRLGALRGAVRRLVDLAWARIGRWREMIAQSFQDPLCSARVRGIQAIRIGSNGARPTAEACYLAAWLKRRLPAAVLQWEQSRYAPIGSVHLIGNGVDVSIRAKEDADSPAREGGGEKVEVVANGVVTHLVLPAADEAMLLHEELCILGRDPEFEAALSVASELASSAS